MKFILEDLHGCLDHPSSTARRINTVNKLLNIHLNWDQLPFGQNEPADRFGCERSGNWVVLSRQEAVNMAAAQVGLWPLLPFLFLFWPRIFERNNILRCKSYLCYFLSKRMVYLYFLGSEWWCFETKCQSFRPKGLLAWNRVSLSKQVPTRIRRKGGFYQFLFRYSVCS